jgi:ABC-type transporter Mla subunit MlaD
MESVPSRTNYELRVGIFTIIALILLLWGWGWLKSISFRAPQRFTVSFHDVAGLNKNATVNINGVRVGVIENIELKGKGIVWVHPRITAQNVVVTEGSNFTIQTLGLVGAKYMEVTLPEVAEGEPPPKPLDPDKVYVGQDPVRVELVMNEIATSAQMFFANVRSEKTRKKLNAVLNNLNDASAKLNRNMDHFTAAADSVTDTARRFGGVADRAGGAAGNANAFFSQGTVTFRQIDVLSNELRGTNRKLQHTLDQPLFGGDLRGIVDKATAASDQFAVAMHEFSGTVKDEQVRKDLLTIAAQLRDSSSNIATSVSTVKDLANNTELRGEIKDTILNAREAINQASGLFTGTTPLQGDVGTTMASVKKAACNVDIAARQLQEVVGKRAPLLHMLFGKPGKLPPTGPDYCAPGTICPPGTAPAPGTVVPPKK